METNSEILSQLKMLLGISDDSTDSILLLIINDTINMVLGYCHITELPRQLESFIPFIAADIYRAKGYGKTDAPEDVKSITEGERTVSLETHRPNYEAVLSSYYKRLDPYKCMKGRVPSDIG